MIIRKAAREEMPRLLAMLRDDIFGGTREAGDESPYYEAFDDIAASPSAELVVGVIDGEIVGMYQVDYLRFIGNRGARVAQIGSVRVRRELRGRGLGREMMQLAIDEARRRGCHRVQLTTDNRREEAHRFYDSLGFERSHLGMKLTLVR